jgi:hypothetical protein
MLAFVSIDSGQSTAVHSSSEPRVAIRNSIAQIENNQVRPVPKTVQNWITMDRGKIA